MGYCIPLLRIRCMSGTADHITVFPAANPEDILWKNITVPLNHQKVLDAQIGCIWIFSVLFWSIPVNFVTSLANLNSILMAFGAEPVDSTTASYALITGLLPVIFLAIFMFVLYLAIQAAATHWIRFKSSPEVDAYTFTWHQLFQFANLWLILIGGSLYNQLDTIVNDPMHILHIIATALPGTSVFLSI